MTAGMIRLVLALFSYFWIRVSGEIGLRVSIRAQKPDPFPRATSSANVLSDGKIIDIEKENDDDGMEIAAKSKDL